MNCDPSESSPLRADREFPAPGGPPEGAPGSPEPPGGPAAPSPPIALGPYVITRPLGAGGMGIVYEAIDREGQRVALKTLERMDASGVCRLKKEFRSVADITHPNLAALYELVSEDGFWFFTMELVDGVSFLEYVSEDEGPGGEGESVCGGAPSDPRQLPSSAAAGPAPQPAGPAPGERASDDRAPAPPPRADEALTLRSVSRDDGAPTLRSEPPSDRIPGAPPGSRRMPRALQQWAHAAPVGSAAGPAVAHRASITRVRRALRQLASAVNTLHRAGKLHRDIKPANLLVTREGRVVVLDFGLVSEARGGRGVVGDVEGTPGYMAPEQVAGDAATPASDWYAVGGVLYQALTGRLPFAANEILTAKLDREPPPPSAIAPDVPPDLDALCVALLRRRPGDRPSGAEILRRLEGASASKAFPSGEWRAARRVQSEPPASCNPRALLGRDAPLAALLAAQAAVAPGAPITVHVRGRSGMGKTTIVHHFVRALRRGDVGPGGRPPAARGPRAPEASRPPPPSCEPPRNAPAGGPEAPKTVRSPHRTSWPPLDGPDDAADRPGGPPALVLSCRCHEREWVPYKVFDSLIDALTTYLRKLPRAVCATLLPADIADLTVLFPVLNRVAAIAQASALAAPIGRADPPGGAPPDGPVETRRCASDGSVETRRCAPDGPAEIRRRASDALRALLRNLAATAPLVIAIDDLQWGDLESARLLRELLSPPDAPGLLFIAAYRSDALDRSTFLRDLLADPPCEARTIEVGPLPLEATRRLALARLGRSGRAAEDCAARIASEADGSPFLVEELIHYARNVRSAPNGAPPLAPAVASRHRGGTRGRCAPTSMGKDGAPPAPPSLPTTTPHPSSPLLAAPTLEELLAARLITLPPEARRLLEVVAVAGGPVPRRVALDAAEVDVGAARALHVLCVGGLLWTGGVRDEDAVDTYHDRIRERVLAALTPAALARHRAALAQAQGDASAPTLPRAPPLGPEADQNWK